MPHIGQTVYCTKYSISCGVLEAVVVSTRGAYVAIKDGSQTISLWTGEWWATRAEALRDALHRLQKALDAMTKRRANLLERQEELQAELRNLECR